ncbi:MAG TPA: twin-arginine translocase TatA/TatE family subunit [Candidatus Kryptonia bacterium]
MLEDLSIGKILLILVVVMIFFGPKKIPDLAQSIGKGIREFKKAMHDVSDEVKKSPDAETKPQMESGRLASSSQPGVADHSGTSNTDPAATDHKS